MANDMPDSAPDDRDPRRSMRFYLSKVQNSPRLMSVAGSCISALSFLGGNLLSWVAVAAIVPTLYAFATLMLQVPAPSYVEIFSGECMFVVANVVLWGRTAWSAFKSPMNQQSAVIASVIAAVLLTALSWAGIVFAETKKP